MSSYPDFAYAYIDEFIEFVSTEGDSKDAGITITADDPTYRVGRLQSANTPPMTVAPDTTLPKIVTLMLTNDFSQLPVMNGTRDVKGIVSQKTIGSRLSLRKACEAARDFMEPALVISSEESLLSVISAIGANDCVLVRGLDQQISGIITASDLNEQFRMLAEPFLLVGEVENGVRRMLHGKFSAAELNAAKFPGDDTRTIEGVADLTFGEYVRLIEPDERWKRLGIAIDRTEFIKHLAKIREIRNDVMHFDPDGLDDKDLTTLRDFAHFLRRLRDIGTMQYSVIQNELRHF